MEKFPLLLPFSFSSSRFGESPRSATTRATRATRRRRAIEPSLRERVVAPEGEEAHEEKQGTAERERRRGGRERKDALFFFKIGKNSVGFSFCRKLPLLALPMTRSHAAASAALACTLLLCAASFAEVREREASSSSSLLFFGSLSPMPSLKKQHFFSEFLRVARPRELFNCVCY